MDSYWGNIQTFEELQQAMIMFLSGQLPSNPWHETNVDPETVPLLENLHYLNGLGFITTESQPGTCSLSDRQRAYIQGFIHRDLVTKTFLRRLEDLNIYAILMDYKRNKVIETNNYHPKLKELTLEINDDRVNSYIDNGIFFYNEVSDTTEFRNQGLLEELFDEFKDLCVLHRMNCKLNEIEKAILNQDHKTIMSELWEPFMELRAKDQQQQHGHVNYTIHTHFTKDKFIKYANSHHIMNVPNDGYFQEQFRNLRNVFKNETYGIQVICLNQCDTHLVEDMIKILTLDKVEACF